MIWTDAFIYILGATSDKKSSYVPVVLEYLTSPILEVIGIIPLFDDSRHIM